MKRVATQLTLVETPPSIPLRIAALCLDCDRVFPIATAGCPACASRAFAPLSTWLNGPERKGEPCAA